MNLLFWIILWSQGYKWGSLCTNCLVPCLDDLGQENTVCVCELDEEIVGAGWLACEKCIPKGGSCVLTLESS